MAKEVDDTEYCPVCFEAYEETEENIPRLLHCAHSLCHGCVQRLLTLNRFLRHQTLCCPQCRRDSEAPDGALSFPQNRYILKNFKATRNGGYFQVCKKHGREVSLFCNGSFFSVSKECRTEICSLCLTRDHRNHRVVDLLEKKKEEIKSLSTDIEEVIDDLNGTKVKLMETKKEVEEKFKRDTELLNSRLASCRNLFDSRLSKTERVATDLKHIRNSVDENFTLKSIEKKRDEYKNILTDHHKMLETPVKYKSCNVEETEKEFTLRSKQHESEEGDTFSLRVLSVEVSTNTKLQYWGQKQMKLTNFPLTHSSFS